jgi:hypothetical protein
MKPRLLCGDSLLEDTKRRVNHAVRDDDRADVLTFGRFGVCFLRSAKNFEQHDKELGLSQADKNLRDSKHMKVFSGSGW